ncbi:dipeptidase 1 isoform X2 [Camelus bactrianus]|uniref:Dipeptidase 1 isoform X2 n=1 Tax=Camelus bactrianus TaxID=9837 RepID=A0A9W3FL83_CAMBA
MPLFLGKWPKTVLQTSDKESRTDTSREEKTAPEKQGAWTEVTWTKGLCLSPGQDSQSGGHIGPVGKPAPGDQIMWASWWFWPLVAICTADQFRDQAVQIMQDTPAIDGGVTVHPATLTSTSLVHGGDFKSAPCTQEDFEAKQASALPLPQGKTYPFRALSSVTWPGGGAQLRCSPMLRHNDLPWQLLKSFNNQLLDTRANLSSLAHTHTNIPKLKAGFVGGQFWSAYTPCDTQNKDAVKRTLEQIDVIHRMCQLYPETFVCVTNSTGIRQAFQEGKVASLVGVEGGHSIDSSLAVLRALYQLGMRYLTLTHSCNTPWADNWLVDTGTDTAQSQGLSSFGQSVIKEMNRLGVLIDLAHVSVATMKAALQLSKAPVIFSHSSAYQLCQHRRNVPDDVLQLVKQTGSLVMVNFYNDYVSCKAEANLSQVADHLDHIKAVAGAGAVGFGGDFDGVSRLPSGLEDVSKYPDLVAELLRRKWTEAEVRGALADNLLRVFEEVEQVSNHTQAPGEEVIPLTQLEPSCRTQYGYSKSSGKHLQPGALLASLVPLLLCQGLL